MGISGDDLCERRSICFEFRDGRNRVPHSPPSPARIFLFFGVTLVNPRFSNFHIYQRRRKFSALTCFQTTETRSLQGRTEAPPLELSCSAVTARKLRKMDRSITSPGFATPFNYSFRQQFIRVYIFHLLNQNTTPCC